MSVRKYSVTIRGHSTSFSLEPEFFAEIKRLSAEQKTTVSDLIARIDSERTGNLSSALRLYVLNALKK